MLTKWTLYVYSSIYNNKGKRNAHLTYRRTQLYSSDQDKGEASVKECFIIDFFIKDFICKEKKPEGGYFKDVNASYINK